MFSILYIWIIKKNISNIKKTEKRSTRKHHFQQEFRKTFEATTWKIYTTTNIWPVELYFYMTCPCLLEIKMTKNVSLKIFIVIQVFLKVWINILISPTYIKPERIYPTLYTYLLKWLHFVLSSYSITHVFFNVDTKIMKSDWLTLISLAIVQAARPKESFFLIMICKYACNTHNSWLLIKKYNHKTGTH